MNRYSSAILALPTTLLLLNTAIGQEIIKDKPTPSRAEARERREGVVDQLERGFHAAIADGKMRAAQREAPKQ